MARPASRHPTPAELEILNVLWDRGPVTLSGLCEALRVNRPVATTTVATALGVMLRKKLIIRRRVARGSLWSAAIRRQPTVTGMVAALVDRVFAGSAHSLVAHLIDQGELTAAQRRELLDLLRRGKKGTQ
jgi:predicted transcriptional regulator